MAELSIVIPYVNEHPQVMFTIQSIAQELRDRVDFEIIAINNYCDEVKSQGRDEDRGFETIEASVRVNPWLKSLHYKNKLSHWQAKNMGVQASTGKFLMFIDAHCIVSRSSIFKMFQYYKAMHENLNGSIHLPLTYKILESHKLIYKLVDNSDKGEVAYSFTTYRDSSELSYEVPAMSTCGMMITRDLYNKLGGWPTELGIYSGGEHFINFVLAIMGKTKNIFVGHGGHALHHHGDKRGYSYNYDDFTRNRTIASYMFGGKDMAYKYIKYRKGSPQVNNNILMNVLNTCKDHHDLIRSKEIISIKDWLEQWKNK